MLEQTSYAQPALFAMQYALAALWRSWGIQPAVVLGHSVGEVAAACVAGVLSLADAARLIVARGRLMQSAPSGGAMVSVFATCAQVQSMLAETGSPVEVAALNGPEHVVLTGARDAVEAAHRASAIGRGEPSTRRFQCVHSGPWTTSLTVRAGDARVAVRRAAHCARLERHRAHRRPVGLHYARLLA